MGANHRDGEKKRNDKDDYRYPSRGGPARPTVVFIDTVASGLSVFELSEHVEVRYIGGESKYARLGSAEDRAAPHRPHDWTTRQWLVSGRLGVHATCQRCSQRLRKSSRAEAPVIVTLLEHAAKEAEERRRKWEIQRQEMERREAERRRVEREAEREKEIVETISKWRWLVTSTSRHSGIAASCAAPLPR